MTVEILFITGAAGVGKSSLSWEVAHELERRDLSYAAIDTDELDRAWPLPLDDTRRLELNISHLRSWWSAYADMGWTRLVLAGVFVDLDDALRLVHEAIPDAVVTLVRLVASDAALAERVVRREIGSGAAEQLARTRLQNEFIATTADPRPTIIETDDVSVVDIAARLCDLAEWTAR